jgi:hypothetical protein
VFLYAIWWRLIRDGAEPDCPGGGHRQPLSR